MLQHNTVVLTIIAVLAFAANSVLCRLALKDEAIDPAGFTVLRLLSGCLVFCFLLRSQLSFKLVYRVRGAKAWLPSLMLFAYAVSFSFAYTSLDAGTGALLLFGVVQLTMIGRGVARGQGLSFFEVFGVLVSFSGLIYLFYPHLSSPSFLNTGLMVLSGFAWGVYSLMGRGSQEPLQDTSINFLRTLPLVFALLVLAIPYMVITLEGVILAIVSGALASALGYAIWYRALAGLSETEAAVVQLSVPVLASVGGVLFITESLSLRLMLACLMVLGGIALSIFAKRLLANTNRI